MFADLLDESIASDDADLVARLRANELEARRLAAEQAAIIGEVERRGAHCADGHRSVKGFLKAHLNWSNRDVAVARRVARACGGLAGAGDALREGHVGVAQVDELGRLAANPRVRDQLPGVAPVLLDHAEHLSFEDFRIVTRRWETLADVDGAHERERSRIDGRSATVTDVGGELFVQATGGSTLDAAEIVAVSDSFVEAEFRRDAADRDARHGPGAPTSLLARTDAQRRRDALQAIFRAAAAAVEAGLVVGPVPVVVNVVVSHYDFEHGLAGEGLGLVPTDLVAPAIVERRCETASGNPLLAPDVVVAAIHGRVRRVVIDSAGVIVDFGRERRLFTGPMRTAAKLMGHRCSHPGCDVPADRCQIDHVEEFVRDQGGTSLANAGLECSSHNRFKHRAGLRRTRHGPDHITTERADGTPIGPVGQRVPRRKSIQGVPIRYCRIADGRLVEVDADA